MSRFILSDEKSHTLSPTTKLLATIGLFVLVFLIFVYATGVLSSGNKQRQLDSLKNAINRNIVYHYATTGSYPASLDEIISTYGLTYDTNSFFVDYQPRGQNIMPDVTIIEK